MSRVLPILFNTDMVRAILDGRKTVTRRIIKGNVLGVLNSPYHKEHPEVTDKVLLKKLCRAPYQSGDVLYVRETFQKFPCYRIGEYPTQGNSDRKPDSWDYVYNSNFPQLKWDSHLEKSIL